MITSLQIRDFKCFSDTGRISIRPLTFLVGPNSSGKSSIIQSLLLLRQTVESRDIRNSLTINGNYVKLGSFKELIHLQDPKNGKLAFEFEFLPRKRSRFASPERMLPEVKGAPSLRGPIIAKSIRFAVEFAYNRKAMQVLLSNCTYNVGPDLVNLEILRTTGGKYQLLYQRVSEDARFRTERPIPVGDILKFYSAQTVRRSSSLSFARHRFRRNLEFFASSLAQEVEELFSNVHYLGPLRERPDRSYTASGSKPVDVGQKGEFSVDVLWAQSRTKATREKLLTKVNKWMKAFRIGTTVKLERIGGNQYSLVFKDPQTDLDVNVVDVGFGASQLLPIVIEGFYAPANSMLLIEQPEIHLHPAGQSTLGDLLIDISRTDPERTLIVETHSDHLLSRIRRRIAEGAIAREDVAIYYCQPSKKGTTIVAVQLDEQGRYVDEGLPTGFFEESYEEAVEHFKAVTKSQLPRN